MQYTVWSEILNSMHQMTYHISPLPTPCCLFKLQLLTSSHLPYGSGAGSASRHLLVDVLGLTSYATATSELSGAL